MLDYLVETVAITFVVGAMLGAFIVMQFAHVKMRPMSQRSEPRK